MGRAHVMILLVCCSCGARTDLGATRGTDASVLESDFVWWKLDETSGTTAHDSSSHHYDVTLEGVTWNDGAVFDGATCGSVDVDASFRDPPITITAWLGPTARSDRTTNDYGLTPYPPNAVSGDTPGAGGYGIGVDLWTDGTAGSVVEVETGVGAGTGGFHTVPTPLTPAAVTFVALVVLGTQSSVVYIAGNVLAQETANVPPSVSPPRFHLGCHNDDTGYGTKRFFRGRIRDARIYQRALAASEIASLYAAGPAP